MNYKLRVVINHTASWNGDTFRKLPSKKILLTYSTELRVPKLPLQSVMHLLFYKYIRKIWIIFSICFLICRHRKHFVLIPNLSSANMNCTGPDRMNIRYQFPICLHVAQIPDIVVHRSRGETFPIFNPHSLHDRLTFLFFFFPPNPFCVLQRQAGVLFLG